MKQIFEQASWIWCNSSPGDNEYGEFIDSFFYEAGKVFLRISADSNYAAYLNGCLAAWGQYADYPYDKVYDQVDVTEYCRSGENRLAVLVWYYGPGLDTSQIYYPGNAGLLYELECGGDILCQSDERTLARMSRAYRNHDKKQITRQLGFSYGYDAVKEDSWLVEEASGFAPAAIVDQKLPLRIRPCKKLTLKPEAVGRECKRFSDTDVIFDLGREQVGFLSFCLTSPCEQEIMITYGEHLADGRVRHAMGGRDFSISYRAKKGENHFMNPFRRLGCRYLEVYSRYPVEILKMAIAPTMYELAEKERPKLTEKQNKIYDMCVETLRLCMHEHYEDCPWREQALYTMDSRNQMLCGYYAFGEYQFPRASLQLISRDRRADGMLSISYPMIWDYVIPSFTLHYVTECREYLEYSGDQEFLREIYPKLTSCLEAFTSHRKGGLVYPFPGGNYWNFYEWREGMDGMNTDVSAPDLMLNALLSLALKNMAFIAETLGVKNEYAILAEALNEKIREVFWAEEKGIFYNLPSHDTYSQLGNALAVLCGAAAGEDAKVVCEHLLKDKDMTPISLSMKCFKYDAWLSVDRERYEAEVLRDIEETYTPMIEYGSTTVWESEVGQSDFENAGSLCHGWSALPIYYYHTIRRNIR